MKPALTMFLDGLPELALTPEGEQVLVRVAVDESQPYTLRENSKQSLVLATMRFAFVYAKRVTRSKLPDDELLSLCYAALAKSVKNYKPGSQTFLNYSKVYLRGEAAATWRAKDVVRGAYKHETPAPDSDEVPKPMSDDFAEPEFNNIHWKEKWGVIEPIIRRRLNLRERSILELRYRHGKNFREIGEILGDGGRPLTRSAVQLSHNKALLKLRNILLGKGLFYER